MLVHRAVLEFLGHHLGFLSRLVRENIVWLHLGQIELLWPQNRSRSGNSDPADEGLSRNLEVLHGPKSDQCACSSQSCLAVNGDGASIWLCKMCIHHLKKLINDIVRWRAAIDEKEIVVFYSIVNKVPFVILFFVQSNHALDPKLVENVDIHLGFVSVPLGGITLLNWPHEGHELAGDDPVEVAVFDFLIVLIFSDIKGLKIVPLKFHSIFQALQDLEEGALIQAISLAGISVGLEKWCIWLKSGVSILGGHVQQDDHEGAHKERSIDHLVRFVGRTVVKNSIVLVFHVPQEPRQLPCIPMNHGQIQWAEVLIEGKVSQIIINIEEKGVPVILWRLTVAHPVKAV